MPFSRMESSILPTMGMVVPLAPIKKVVSSGDNGCGKTCKRFNNDSDNTDVLQPVSTSAVTKMLKILILILFVAMRSDLSVLACNLFRLE